MTARAVGRSPRTRHRGAGGSPSRRRRCARDRSGGDPTPAASLESLDLNRPEVQRYVAELLVDPAFDKFVGDLAEYYDRLKKTLPRGDGESTPFVRGQGGTASKRSDPMDEESMMA